jgi:hypothetical protein
MDNAFFESIIKYYNSTSVLYGDVFPLKSNAYPIPFFGNIKKAKVLTIGVNPSIKEFKSSRCWPSELSAQSLRNRLENYFLLIDVKPYPWFDIWENALNHLDLSYQNSSVAHVDLSMRPTTSIGRISDRKRVCEIIAKDMYWFFQCLNNAPKSKLILMAGTVTGNYYINEFIQEYALLYNVKLTGNSSRRSIKGNTSFHRLITPMLDIPAFFCSSSPSNQNRKDLHILPDRIRENKPQLLEYLAK